MSVNNDYNVVNSSTNRWNYLNLLSSDQQEAAKNDNAKNLGPVLSGYNYSLFNAYQTSGNFSARPLQDGVYLTMPVELFKQLYGENEGAHVKVGSGVEFSTKISTKGGENNVSGANGNLGIQLQAPTIPLYGNCNMVLKGNFGINLTQLYYNNDIKNGNGLVQLESDAAGIYFNRLFDLKHKSSGNLALLTYTNYRLSGEGMSAFNSLYGSELNVNKKFTQWYEARFSVTGNTDEPHLMASTLFLYGKLGQLNDDTKWQKAVGFGLTDNNKVFLGVEARDGTPYTNAAKAEQTPPPNVNLTLNYNLFRVNDDYVNLNVGVNNIMDMERIGGMIAVNAHVATVNILGMDWNVNMNLFCIINRNNEPSPVAPGTSSDTARITEFVDPNDGGNVLLALYRGQSKAFTIDENSKATVTMGTTNPNGLPGVVFEGTDSNVPVVIKSIAIQDVTDADDPQDIPLDPADLAGVLNQEIPNMSTSGTGGLVLNIPTKSGSYNALNGKNKVVYNIKIDFETNKSDVQNNDPGGNLKSMTITVIWDVK